MEDDKISFMGVSLSKDGPSDHRIIKALAASSSLLDILKFIDITEFELNRVMFNYFWQVIVGNRSTLVGRAVLEWFGYDGDYFKQRQNFKKMLKNNNIHFGELTQKDKEIELYPTIKEELQIINEGARACAKFLIMEPNDIKRAIMQLKTKNGDIIRNYYIDLEELMKLYVEYTLCFNHREAQRKITNLEKMMKTLIDQNENLKDSLAEIKDQNEILINQNSDLNDKLDDVQGDLATVQDKLEISVEDRCPKVRTTNKLEQFMLLKKNKRGDRYPYYVICGQKVYVSSRLSLLKKRFPNMETLLKLEYQPNTKNLFGRFKETFKSSVIVRMNDIQLVTLDEIDLVNAFIKLDEDKAIVEEEPVKQSDNEEEIEE